MTDIYQDVTNRIVAAIEENPGEFVLPWHRGGSSGTPQNALTKALYQGVNIITLWIMGLPYPEPVWATYRQWQELGCQVRRGERGSPIIFYSVQEKEDGEETNRVPFIRQSTVFNANQVDGYTSPEKPKTAPLERLEAVDGFVAKTGANIVSGGSRACYVPTDDVVRMPDEERFFDTKTQTRTEGYYSTLMHELTHWTGHKNRLARDLAGRFGNEAYAMEELVAELGAAFLCARLTITPEVRADHSQYIANWLQVLKNDKRAIFSASTQAQLAADYLLGLSPDPAH